MTNPSEPATKAAHSVARGSVLMAIGVLTVVGTMLYSAKTLSDAHNRLVAIQDSIRLKQHIADSLDRENEARAHLLDSLTAVADRPPPAKKGSLDKPAPSPPVGSVDTGKRAEALRLALSFRDKAIPFKWGGKSPEEGFDSSGFVAYILWKVGALDNYRTYWSGALQERFRTRDVRSVEDLNPGDLVFYRGGYCALYLGDRQIIGMVYGSIQVADLTFGPDIAGFGRVSYAS